MKQKRSARIAAGRKRVLPQRRPAEGEEARKRASFCFSGNCVRWNKRYCLERMFCDVEKKGVISLEQLKRWLPEEVTEIISRAGAFDFERAEEESEQVIFIKLAERLHNLRTMEFMDRAEWKKRAEETIKLFLPMAKKDWK